MSGNVRYIGLTFELGQIADALEAASILVDAQATDQLATEEQMRRTPRAVAAVLGLVQQRLKLVTGAIRHQVDPGLLLSPANDVTGWMKDDDPEIRIRVPARAKKRGAK